MADGIDYIVEKTDICLNHAVKNFNAHRIKNIQMHNVNSPVQNLINR